MVLHIVDVKGSRSSNLAFQLHFLAEINTDTSIQTHVYICTDTPDVFGCGKICDLM